jgi:general L-amino acid transport system ATP-binding protein
MGGRPRTRRSRRMDKGEIVEEAPPEVFFSASKSERAKAFLGQILNR